ncbi:DUF2256 domain-containing protein [Shimia sp. SDUM112013]|uniref:DUF2256 domain-containing protein n=1 Tax=Shimia sp. SDUM112013 TaxID=3136160 RepID=UPI0032EE1A15
MARHRKKGDLPTRICATCGRPFTWRRKWKDCWDQVRYCSDRCRRHRSEKAPEGRAKSFT